MKDVLTDKEILLLEEYGPYEDNKDMISSIVTILTNRV